MFKGTMDFRIGDEKRTVKPGDVVVIPGGIEHKGFFPEDSEAIDFFAPVARGFPHRRATGLHAQRVTASAQKQRVRRLSGAA